MSYDLMFFSYQKGMTAKTVKEAAENIYNGNIIDWPESSDFNEFYEKVTTDFPEADEQWGCTSLKTAGYWQISLRAGQTDFHSYLGGQLMMHSVISYNPQTGEVMPELEPLA